METSNFIHYLIKQEILKNNIEEKYSYVEPFYLLTWLNKKNEGLFEVQFNIVRDRTSGNYISTIHQIGFVENVGNDLKLGSIKDILKYNFKNHRKGVRGQYSLQSFYCKRMWRAFIRRDFNHEIRYLSEFYIYFPEKLVQRYLSNEDYIFCLDLFKDRILQSNLSIK